MSGFQASSRALTLLTIIPRPSSRVFTRGGSSSLATSSSSSSSRPSGAAVAGVLGRVEGTAARRE